MLHAWELVQATGSSTSSTSSSRTAAAAQRLLEAGLLLPGEEVLIIGGGLTSVHLASMAAAAAAAGVAQLGQQCGSITLLLRGGLRVKQFDVDVAWMGRHRKQQLQQGFKSLKSMSERAKALKRALQVGGWEGLTSPGCCVCWKAGGVRLPADC
jgi:1-aminocyclopropane-1-carboxylate deaminase/D-cysteine desulfhydrase-like pyridoxal-dependent ACC family enzyme